MIVICDTDMGVRTGIQLSSTVSFGLANEGDVTSAHAGKAKTSKRLSQTLDR